MPIISAEISAPPGGTGGGKKTCERSELIRGLCRPLLLATASNSPLQGLICAPDGATFFEKARTALATFFRPVKWWVLAMLAMLKPLQGFARGCAWLRSRFAHLTARKNYAQKASMKSKRDTPLAFAIGQRQSTKEGKNND